jgi:hypothetical protein
LFYFARSNFENFQSHLSHGGNGRTPGFSHDQGRLEILGIKQSLHDTYLGIVFFKHVPQGLQDLQKATGSRPPGGAADGAMLQGLRDRLGDANDPKAGAAQRGIEPQDHGVAFRLINRGDLKDRRSPPRLAKPLLYLIELLWSDTHILKMPAQGDGRKDKTGVPSP